MPSSSREWAPSASAASGRRHPARQRFVESALRVDGRQLASRVRARRLTPLAGQTGILGIGLRLHRYVLARRHRHGARHQAGDAREQDGAVRCAAGGDADHQAGHRHHPVVGAQHGRAEPTDALRTVGLDMVGAHAAL